MNVPWRFSLIALLVVAVALVGCGGQTGPGGVDEADLPDRAAASSDDPEGELFPLQSGRYRLSYRAPGCQEVVIAITAVDADFSYEQRPRGFTSFINDMPAGDYTIDVVSDCDNWTINLNKF